MEKIDRYHIESLLGKGAMGEVYLAFDPVLERHVALKTIRVDRLDVPEERTAFTQRFLLEARIGGKLRHPCVVTIHDIGQWKERPYIVMEYVRGISLARRLREGPPLSRKRCHDVLTGLAQALDRAHHAGIVHRDIKPQNIMLPEEGGVKVLDFGIAKLMGGELTAEGEFWGTPAYASPEQISERKADHRSDIYSMGVLMHKMMTGRDCFGGADLKELFFHIIHEEPDIAPPFPALQVDEPFFRAVVNKALRKQPPERYQKALDFADDVARLFEKGALVKVRDEDDAGEHGGWETTRTTSDEDQQTLPMAKILPDDDTRLSQLRKRFGETISAGNLMAAKRLLVQLQRKGADVKAEEQAYETARNGSGEADASEQLRLIHHKKQAFRQQLDAGDLDAAQRVLDGLRVIDAATEEETQALLTEKKQRLSKSREVRKHLHEALEQGNLSEARLHLRKLKKLGAEVTEVEAKVETLSNQQMRRARDMMAEIATARERFRQAEKANQIIVAGKALATLRELRAQVHKEEQAFDQMRENWTTTNTMALQELKDDIKRLLNLGDFQGTYELLDRLDLLAGDERFSTRWRRKCERAERKAKQKKYRDLEEALEQAIDADEEDRIRELQHQLAQMGDDSPMYFWLLQKANGKETGPRPGGNRIRLILAAATLTLVSLALWYFWPN